MVQVFLRAALQAVAERPFIPRGLPRYLLSDAWCDTRADPGVLLLARESLWSRSGWAHEARHTVAGTHPHGRETAKRRGRCIHDNSSWNCDPSYRPSGIPNVAVPSLKLLRQPKARFCSRLPRIGALFVAVALRPHWQTRMELRLRMASWLEAHPTWRATAHTGHCAAIHVRHGDKYTPAWLDREHPPPNVSLTGCVVKAKRALAHVGIVDTGAMMVMTDDADIIGDVHALQPGKA